MPKRPVSPLTFLVITTALFQALLLAAKTTVAELHVVNLLLRNENSALTAILLALLPFATTAAGATAAAGAAATRMRFAACRLSAATIAPYLTLVKDAFRIGRAGALFAAIPVWCPFVIVALFLGILCFVLALVKAVKTFAKLFIESGREGMRL